METVLAACVHAVRRGRLHDRMHPLGCQIERCRDGCSWCGRSGQLQTKCRPLQAHSIANFFKTFRKKSKILHRRKAGPYVLPEQPLLLPCCTSSCCVVLRPGNGPKHASMLFIRDSGTGSFAAGILSNTQHHQFVRKLR